MIVIFLLIPLSIMIAVCFLGAFVWAVRSGQYEDTCTPAMRLLVEEKKTEIRSFMLFVCFVVKKIWNSEPHFSSAWLAARTVPACADRSRSRCP